MKYLDLCRKLALFLVSTAMIHDDILFRFKHAKTASLLLGKKFTFPRQGSAGCELSLSAMVCLIYSLGTDHQFPG